ncbi:hypothetical protein M2138_000578 [Dysgonomonadaceae bacterium PH5-43]|nr:hypothetical protein [Dysgonomonadaceae bacterium PH5-43]
MKKSLLLGFVLQITIAVYPQFKDNFDDGLFHSSMRTVNWNGDISDFIVNDYGQLQLDSDVENSPVQLRTVSKSTKNTSWSFFMELEFTPSSSNYARVYLMSEQEDLLDKPNGYFIRLGHTDKNICLMQSQSDKNNKTLIKGEKNRLNVAYYIGIDIKATLDNAGNFNLYSKFYDEDEYVLEGSCVLTDIYPSNYFGIICNFTKTRSQAFFFDNFVVKELSEEDTPKPEEPDKSLTNFGDLLFSEIMANPPNGTSEYVELYNNTKDIINLKNYLFYYGTKAYLLPDEYILPNSYFVLSKESMTSFPTLANAGKLLMLTTQKGDLISWFEYSDYMYNDTEKKKGGWSLECKDLSNMSNVSDNWSASITQGGTPGKDNSIKCDNPDNYPLELTSVLPQGDATYLLEFSKPINPETITTKTSYSLDNSEYSITNIESNYPQSTEALIQLNKELPEDVWITLSLNGIKDLSGASFNINNSTKLGYASQADEKDILINEILFNPPADCDEYIELINNSQKNIDLRFLSITNRKPSDNSFNKTYPLCKLPFVLKPKEYAVITKSKQILKTFYNCDEKALFAEPASMPSLSNVSGCVVVLNNTDDIVDEFYYNQSLHSSGVSNKKGVALERLSLDIETNEPSNWTSASSLSGYGTPGYRNSQLAGIEITKSSNNKFTLEYPDFEGGEYTFHYNLDKPNYNCRIVLFDIAGRMVSSIVNNETLGVSGTIIWRNNQQLVEGVYICFIEIFDKEGHKDVFKIPMVIGHR